MRSRPVISKILMMFSSVQMMSRLPLRGRTRFAPLTSTPRAVESMKVTRDRSTITLVAPLSMPVTRTQLYLSVFVPMMVWLTAIAMVQAILVIIAGGGVQLAARFVSMSILISVVFGVIGVSSAVGGYPDRVDALKRFLGWMLVLAVSIVFLYKYRMVVMMAVAALSLLFLLPKRLYRT